MSTKHTPGAWTVSELDATGEPSEHYIFIEPNVAVIERKVEGRDGCDMPDARLIAAAPELLEFVQEYLSAWQDGMAGDSYLHRIAKAVIAKATGEQP